MTGPAARTAPIAGRPNGDGMLHLKKPGCQAGRSPHGKYVVSGDPPDAPVSGSWVV